MAQFRGRNLAVLAAFLVGGCGGKSVPPPAQSARARESTLAGSKLSGAAGVGAALRVSDSAAARQRRLDSISPD